MPASRDIVLNIAKPLPIMASIQLTVYSHKLGSYIYTIILTLVAYTARDVSKVVSK